MKGSQGRPDKEHELYKRINISLPPELYARLDKFSQKEDRAKSWIIKKALEEYVTKKGF